MYFHSHPLSLLDHQRDGRRGMVMEIIMINESVQ